MLTHQQVIDRMNFYKDPRVIAQMSRPSFNLVKDGCIDTEALQRCDIIDFEEIEQEILPKDEKLRKAVMMWGIMRDEETCEYIHWDIPHYEKKMTLLYIMVKFPCTFNQESIETVAKMDGAHICFPQVPVSSSWEICRTCKGEGEHVDPVIDAGGISMDELGQWSHEEEERYEEGFYNVTCSSCDGSGKVRIYEFGSTAFSDWAFKAYAKHLRKCERKAIDAAWEITMGW